MFPAFNFACGSFNPFFCSKMIQCQKFLKMDLQNWISEKVVSGDPVNVENDPLVSAPAVTLFTGAINASAYRSSPTSSNTQRIGSSNFQRTGSSNIQRTGSNNIHETGANNVHKTGSHNIQRTGSNNIQRTESTNIQGRDSSSTQKTSSNKPLQPVANPIAKSITGFERSRSNSSSAPSPQPSNNLSSVDAFKSNSSTSSRAQSPLTVHVSTEIKKSSEVTDAEDQFLSQFLEGVDTDSLFDDF